MCILKKIYIYDQPPRTPRTYHVLVCIHIIVLKLYLFISMIISFWSPQDLIHLFMVFTICNARFLWPNFTTVLVVPSNCKYFKTERSTVYLYINFAKPVRNHLSFVFFTTSLLLPNKNSAWTWNQSCYTLHLPESLSSFTVHFAKVRSLKNDHFFYMHHLNFSKVVLSLKNNL